MATRKAFILSALLVLMTAACGSMGDTLGGLGGALGDILGSTGTANPSDIRGTVRTVDTSERRIDLDVEMVNQLRDARPGSSIYWDQNTRVVYQNQTYSPENLERGDVVEVTGAANNNTYIASEIRVVRDVSPN